MFKRRQRRKNKKFTILLFWLFATAFLTLGLFAFQFYKTQFDSSYVSPLSQSLSNNLDENELRNLLNTHKISFASVSIASDSSFLVFLSKDEIAILSSKKPLSEQVSSLQRILMRLTIEGKSFQRLDLRFDKPVVQFQ